MYVCMYVCMCVCVCVCMYIYIYIYIYIFSTHRLTLYYSSKHLSRLVFQRCVATALLEQTAMCICIYVWSGYYVGKLPFGTVSEGRASSSASRLSQYMLESMFPSINCSSLVPAVLRQPQTMMLPPPCLTLGKAQFSWYSLPGHHHTCWTPSESNKFTLDSSDHRTWFQ